jgi:hypothetical protein
MPPDGGRGGLLDMPAPPGEDVTAWPPPTVARSPRPARIQPAMEGSMAPTPEAVADALEVAAMGGDLGRLAEVCRARADAFEGDGRQRLLDAAAAMTWAAQLLEAVDGRDTAEKVHAEH